MLPRIHDLHRGLAALAAGMLLLASVACNQATPEDRLNEAQQLLGENQVPLAVMKLRELIKDEPEAEATLAGRFLLGRVYAELGGPDNLSKGREQAQAVLDQAGLASEAGFAAFSLLTETYLREGNFDQALATLDSGVEQAQALGDEALEEELRLRRAGLMLNAEQEEQRAEAAEIFRATMLENENPGRRGEAREILADYFRSSSQFAESNEVYQAYIDKYPEEEVIPQLYMAQGLNLQAMEQEAAAEEVFDKGAARMRELIEEELNADKKVRLQNDLAQMLTVFGKYEHAEEMYRTIMAENVGRPPAIQAQMAIGNIYVQQRDFNRARDHYQQMAQENPGSQIAMQAEQILQRIDAFEEQLAASEAAEGAAAADDTAPAAEMEATDPPAPAETSYEAGDN